MQFRLGQQQAAGSAGPAGSAAPAVPAGPEPCCGGCGAPPSGSVVLRACGACHAVKYCSAACQLKDWSARHSAECGQLQQLAALLQQAGAAGSAGTALDDASTRLLAAALHQPGGRQAAMLRTLLPADSTGSSAGVVSTAASAPSPDAPGSITGGHAGGESGAAEAALGAAEAALGEAADAEAAAGGKPAAAEPAGPPAQPGEDGDVSEGLANATSNEAPRASTAAPDEAGPADAVGAGVAGAAHVAAPGPAQAAAGPGDEAGMRDEAGVGDVRAPGSGTDGSAPAAAGSMAGQLCTGDEPAGQGDAEAAQHGPQADAAGRPGTGGQERQLPAEGAAAACEEEPSELSAAPGPCGVGPTERDPAGHTGATEASGKDGC